MVAVTADRSVVDLNIALVVDVDGTLVKTDLLYEAVLQFVARYPLQTPRILQWLALGKSNLKTRLADRVNPGIATVPLRFEVLNLIQDAQAEGRPVYLASASDRRYIEELADRIGGIAGVFGTEPGVNLSGSVKAERLIEAFGSRGYDYVGDLPKDFAVWRSARNALVVAHTDRFAAKVAEAFPNAKFIARPKSHVMDYIRALRPHQWAKNVLLFLPMIAGHHFDTGDITDSLLGFVCFCLAASSAYVINDLLDLPDDRDNPKKQTRPFAAGDLPIARGIMLATFLLMGAFVLSLLLPVRFTGILAVYITCTLVYSLFLKRKVLIDVVTLAGLYTVRVYGGLAAINSKQTPWLLMFSLFLFLSLAIVKRCSELIVKRDAGKLELMGRGYRVADLSVLLALGASAGYGAVFVVALYVSSPEVAVLYTHPSRLWLICPLLAYWISRILIISNRGELHHDPVIFPMTDRVSWITALCVVGVIGIAI
jgi:4-hydroxybenzoate polyprenyltransferase/phosphoserine phosphatase